jgi:hypothetical protein
MSDLENINSAEKMDSAILNEIRTLLETRNSILNEINQLCLLIEQETVEEFEKIKLFNEKYEEFKRIYVKINIDVNKIRIIENPKKSDLKNSRDKIENIDNIEQLMTIISVQEERLRLLAKKMIDE